MEEEGHFYDLLLIFCYFGKIPKKKVKKFKDFKFNLFDAVRDRDKKGTADFKREIGFRRLNIFCYNKVKKYNIIS